MTAAELARVVVEALDDDRVINTLSPAWLDAYAYGPNVFVTVDPDEGATKYYRLTIEEVGL